MCLLLHAKCYIPNLIRSIATAYHTKAVHARSSTLQVALATQHTTAARTTHHNSPPVPNTNLQMATRHLIVALLVRAH